jgi:hypothetical protein
VKSTIKDLILFGTEALEILVADLFFESNNRGIPTSREPLHNCCGYHSITKSLL